MKTSHLIAFVVAVSAVSIGVISSNGISATPMAVGSVIESGGMVGHVEYTLYDKDGNIKSYAQGDNFVVNNGDDCVAAAIFGEADECTLSSDGFTFIGIANGTQTIDNSDVDLDDGSGAICNADDEGPGPGGSTACLMAVKEDTNVITTASSGSGATVVIATETPFSFSGAGNAYVNATTITAAGLFDASCNMSTNANAHCIGSAGSANMDMFAAQDISVIVNDGDSLSVSWTITIGNSS
jgi:hypothetical protein